MVITQPEERRETAGNGGECPEGVPSDRIHEAFWKFVVKGDGCWRWTGAVGRGGYGMFHRTHAHRMAFRISGVDPTGFYVCHRCDNRLCCNPAHLFLGTARDNTQDCIAKGRFKGGKTPKPNFPEETVSRVVELATAGVMTRREIAEACGMGERNLYVILAQHRNQLPRRKRG